METIRNVTRHKLRSFLTISGITIGVLALTTMGALAENFNALIDGGVAYFGSSVQVVLVDAQDQLRLGEIKLVITAVNKDPSGIKKGAHCAIAQNRMRRENPDKS